MKVLKIKCPFCTKKIPTEAQKCPNCLEWIPDDKKTEQINKEVKADNQANGCLAGCLGIFVILLALILLMPSSKEGQVSNKPDEIDLMSAGQIYMKEIYLNDPKSYESVEWSKPIETENGFTMGHRFRAKNGFGGVTTKDVVIIFDKTGNPEDIREFP